MKHFNISIAAVILVSGGCSTHLVSEPMTSSENSNEHTLEGRKYFLRLPTGMGSNANFKSAETASCSYAFFVGQPFTLGAMMEEQYSARVVVTHFTNIQYQALKKRDGATFFPDLYAFTIGKIHLEVESYKLPEARGTILRYDVQHSEGIYCLAAIILDRDKAVHVFNADVELMKETLKSFKVIR